MESRREMRMLESRREMRTLRWMCGVTKRDEDAEVDV